MPMISYAQNREDVILARVFREPTGFYIDVGAAHPFYHSVTKWFYERGWTGVNVEPQPEFFKLLTAERPRDVNLGVAVSDRNGESTFHDINNSIGCSTLEAGVAGDIEAGGGPVSHYPIRTMTLDRICELYARRPIDFLKIDVEGHEREVLLGFDLAKWRPRVLVVEATKPSSPDPSHGDWEPIVLAHGYCFAFFDGLNRYYVPPEDEALIPKLAVPPNTFDDYIPLDQSLAADATQAARDEVQTLLGLLYHARTDAERAHADGAEARTEAEQARNEAEHAQGEAEHARAEAEQARNEAEHARGEAEQARAEARLAATSAEQARVESDEKLEQVRQESQRFQAALAAAQAQLLAMEQSTVALTGELVLLNQNADLLKSELNVMSGRYEQAAARIAVMTATMVPRTAVEKVLATMVNRTALDTALTVLAETRQHLDTFRSHSLTSI